jgi:hypothetical protein
MSALHKLSIVALILLTSSQTSWAKDPEFAHAKAEEIEESKKEGAEWTAQAQAGLLLTTGNSSATTLSSGFQASRKEGKNKVVVNLNGAFARSTILVANDADSDGLLDSSEIRRITSTTSESWLVKPRYDRLLDNKNALYVAAALSSDKPAGKTLIGSGQVGYSRSLITSEVHAVTLETGYDFSYENLEAPGIQSLDIHSVRVFAGYQGKLSKDTSLIYAVEGLLNVNKVDTGAVTVDPLDDTRVENKLALTTNIYGKLSFSFSFLARYDSNPAPRPSLSLPYADGYSPVADRLDTRTEAALILNFL